MRHVQAFLSHSNGLGERHGCGREGWGAVPVRSGGTRLGGRFPVALAPCVRAAIQDYRLQYRPDPTSPYLFPSRYSTGRAVSTSHLKKRFHQLCQRAAVTGPQAHIHTTRHTVPRRFTETAKIEWPWLCVWRDAVWSISRPFWATPITHSHR